MTVALWYQLIHMAHQYESASSTLGKMSALYGIRQLFDEQGVLLYASIDLQLARLEEEGLNEAEKEVMRRYGYQFPEDLDNVPELLCDPDGP